jgi:predicted nicotinamide N-methyase
MASSAAADARAAVEEQDDANPLLQIEALLWELAPRAVVAAALLASRISPEEQQRLLLQALASPPPHAPALLPLLPPTLPPSSGYPPDYLAGVLQRCSAAFMRAGLALDDALAEKLQQAVLSSAAAAATAAEQPPDAAPAAATTTTSLPSSPLPLLKTWCYLPDKQTSAPQVFEAALQSLRQEADERRRRRAAGNSRATTAGLVSLRLSADIFAAGTGATTWAAGFVLSEWLLSRRAERFVRGKRVLELGSGAGLAAACAWRAGAATLTLTDGDPAALVNCARNVCANLDFEVQKEELEEEIEEENNDGGNGGRLSPSLLQRRAGRGVCAAAAGGGRLLRCLPLNWDEAPRLPESVASDADDLVIAADVAYDPLILPGLTRALGALLRRRRRESGAGQQEPLAVVATTVRQESTLALLLELAEREGLRFTDEVEWWRGRQQGDSDALAAAEAAEDDRPWRDDPRFVTVQGLDRRGIKMHVVELLRGRDEE